MYTVELTKKDIELIESTFEARRIRIREWIAAARKEGKQRELELWEELLDSKEEVLNRIKAQVGGKNE